MTRLKKFCIFTPLMVLGISFIIAVIFSFLFMYRLKQVEFRNGLAALFPLFMIGYNILCSLLSYSVCFNLYKKIRDNILFSFLSFYFPLFATIITLFLIPSNSLYTDNLATLGIWLISSIPFLIPQTYYFIRFRRGIKKGLFEANDNSYE